MRDLHSQPLLSVSSRDRISVSRTIVTITLAARFLHGRLRGRFYLWLVSSEVRRLTSSPSRWDLDLEFSPDGQTVAFASGKQAGFPVSIYAVSVSGGEERLLITGPSYEWGLAWTPEGRDIAFRFSRRPASKAHL